MKTTGMFKYFSIDEVKLTDLVEEEFYPIIEVRDGENEESTVATGFYIKTLPESLKFVLLPVDTEIKKNSIVKAVDNNDSQNEPINIYKGELDIQRNIVIENIASRFVITKSSIREIFSLGADWALSIGRPEEEIRKTFKKNKLKKRPISTGT